MKPIQDHFSGHSEIYKKFRPTYPAELYEFILKYVNNRDRLWDCATGNGQVAVALSNHFRSVHATDISEAQLAEATKKVNISYQVCRAEKSSFENSVFDLITVAQAMHWFDLKAFYQEVKRVLKKDGMLAVWGYALLEIESEIDSLLYQFYNETIGQYWSPERKIVESHYNDIPFDFEPITHNEDFAFEDEWSISQLEGYLNSWSAVQHYMKETGKPSPVRELIPQLKPYWRENEKKPVRFPLFLKLGKL